MAEPSKTEKIETAKAIAASAGRVAELRAQREQQFATRQARAVTEPEPDALYLARKLRRDMPNNRAVEIVTKELERLAAIVASANASTPKPAPVDSIDKTSTENVSTRRQTSTPKPAFVDTSTDNVSTPVDAEADRKAYQREWAKRKREERKTTKAEPPK